MWRERQCGDSYQEFFDNYILVDSTAEGTTPDSVYIQRLRALVSPIQLPYNSIVRGYINRYTDSRYGTISRILGMSQYYFPLIEDELLKEGLPVELRALPIIESALSTTAVSPMGARRPVAVHALDGQKLRTGSQLAGRRTPRPCPFDTGRPAAT